ncbi:MAG: formimidoylglutamase [Phycisphaerales bacterium]|nr:formimidoylglutamase [Phycisphaerales bacterium]
MSIPHTQPGQWPEPIAESRFASRIRKDSYAGCDVAIIGMPDDTGVRLNSGRPGAKEGPTALRAALARFGVADPAGWDWPTIYDAGDVEIVPGNLHESHQRVTEAVRVICELGMLPIGIGGGHDLTFPFVRGVSEVHGPLHGVYFDPHLDVRETDGSGMPFRRLVETKAARSLRIHGFDPMSNTRDHVQWFQANGGRIDDTLRPQDPWPDGDTFVSLDLDVIDAAYAPGVSAMNPSGWTPTHTEQWVAAAGRNPGVRCFDIMELSPLNDHAGRTARLAARMLLAFLRGYSERPR